MSRASRRARGRQLEAAGLQHGDSEPVATATRQVGALRVGLTDDSLGIDVKKLEAPAQAYDADAAWIEYRPGRVSLFFAKRNRDDPNLLLSRLEVRYPPEDLINTFWNISTDFFDRLRKYVSS